MTTRSTEAVQLSGPNRDRGKLSAFALKGDLEYRVVTNTETDEQALVVSMPEDALRKIAYDLVKMFEGDDRARARTREKAE